MICISCGNQQNEGTECLACHTPFAGKAKEGDKGLSAPFSLDMVSQAEPSAVKEKEKTEAPKSPDPATSLEEQARLLQEQEKLIRLQQTKMEEEKQRLIELKQNHEKQIQEIKAMEERKRSKESESVIGQAVDKFKNILVTSLPAIENRPILNYMGLVGAQVLIKMEGLETVLSNLKDAAGLRNTPSYECLKKGFLIGLADLKIEASKLNANAVIGVTTHEHYRNDQVLVLSFTGTAVLYKEEELSTSL